MRGHKMPRILRQKLLWLAQYSLSVHSDNPFCAGYFLRKDTEASAVLNEPSYGARLWARTPERRAKQQKQRIEFLLFQIGMLLPLSPQLLKNTIVPQPLALLFWRSVAVIEGF